MNAAELIITNKNVLYIGIDNVILTYNHLNKIQRMRDFTTAPVLILHFTFLCFAPWTIMFFLTYFVEIVVPWHHSWLLTGPHINSLSTFHISTNYYSFCGYYFLYLSTWHGNLIIKKTVFFHLFNFLPPNRQCNVINSCNFWSDSHHMLIV